MKVKDRREFIESLWTIILSSYADAGEIVSEDLPFFMFVNEAYTLKDDSDCLCVNADVLSGYMNKKYLGNIHEDLECFQLMRIEINGEERDYVKAGDKNILLTFKHYPKDELNLLSLADDEEFEINDIEDDYSFEINDIASLLEGENYFVTSEKSHSCINYEAIVNEVKNKFDVNVSAVKLKKRHHAGEGMMLEYLIETIKNTKAWAKDLMKFGI